jgi:hypothetical protein
LVKICFVGCSPDDCAFLDKQYLFFMLLLEQKEQQKLALKSHVLPVQVDVDVLQMLWKSCLVGCGPPGKHIALEAVGTVLDLPPPKPPGSAKPSQTPAEKTAAAAASDPKGATALQRLVQAAVWFLGENANYAASEYAWEPQSAAGQMLMMMEGEKMVMAAGVRNPILAAALSRLQRCAVASSWEVSVLVTWAFRLDDPSRKGQQRLHKIWLLSPFSSKTSIFASR